MGDFTPWALCIGLLFIWPAMTFSIGFYIGRKGMPFSIKIQRNAGWRGKSLAGDGYGLATEDV